MQVAVLCCSCSGDIMMHDMMHDFAPEEIWLAPGILPIQSNV